MHVRPFSPRNLLSFPLSWLLSRSSLACLSTLVSFLITLPFISLLIFDHSFVLANFYFCQQKNLLFSSGLLLILFSISTKSKASYLTSRFRFTTTKDPDVWVFISLLNCELNCFINNFI